MRHRFITAFRVFIACFFALASAFCIRVQHAYKLASLVGKHTYYLYTASSQAVTKTTVLPWEIFRVQGESVTLENADPVSIATRFGGEQVCVERVDGVVSYYYRVDAWQGGIVIAGELVNLHIAVSEQCVVVGTPVIFGGF